MQQNNYSFGDLDGVEDRSEIIPVGIYQIRSVEQEMQDTKDKTGAFLAVQFEVCGGPMQNRKLFVNFNLVNKNPQAVEIALRDVKAWLAACGLPATGQLTMDVINSLEGKVFTGKIGLDKDKSGQYDDQNKISRFIKPEGDAPTPTGAEQPAAAPPAQAPAASDKKPWE